MLHRMGGIGRIKDYAYVSSSSLGGGTSRTLDNVVWSRSPGGGTEGEVCRLRLHLVCAVHLIHPVLQLVHQWVVSCI